MSTNFPSPLTSTISTSSASPLQASPGGKTTRLTFSKLSSTDESVANLYKIAIADESSIFSRIFAWAGEKLGIYTKLHLIDLDNTPLEVRANTASLCKRLGIANDELIKAKEISATDPGAVERLVQNAVVQKAKENKLQEYSPDTPENKKFKQQIEAAKSQAEATFKSAKDGSGRKEVISTLDAFLNPAYAKDDTYSALRDNVAGLGEFRATLIEQAIALDAQDLLTNWDSDEIQGIWREMGGGDKRPNSPEELLKFFNEQTFSVNEGAGERELAFEKLLNYLAEHKLPNLRDRISSKDTRFSDHLAALRQLKVEQLPKDQQIPTAGDAVMQLWKQAKNENDLKNAIEQLKLFNRVTKEPISQIDLEFEWFKKYISFLQIPTYLLRPPEQDEPIGAFMDRLNGHNPAGLEKDKEKLMQIKDFIHNNLPMMAKRLQ